jgi:uncharacterized protein (DUF885 family)
VIDVRRRLVNRWAVSLTLVTVLGACTSAPQEQGSAPQEQGSTTTSSASTSVPESSTTTDPTPPTGSEAIDRLSRLPFDEFVDESYRLLLIRRPQLLTSLGVAGDFGLRNDQLDDLSEEFLLETQSLERDIVGILQSYERAALSPPQQITYDIYAWWLNLQVDGQQFMYHDYPVHHFVNSYNDNLLLFLTEEHPLSNHDDIEDYLARLAQIDNQVADLIEGLERREAIGNVPPDFILTMTISRLQDDLNGATSAATARPTMLPLFATFRDRLDLVELLTEDERAAFLDEAFQLVTDSFVPAWVSLIDHLRSVQAQAGPDAGLWRLPDGPAYYEHLLAVMTSTDLTADQIHQIGLAQVDRLQTELRAAFDQLGYPSDQPTPDLLRRAAADAGFLSGTTTTGRQEVITAWEELIVEIDGQLDPFFDRRPAADVIVVPEEFGAGGYYVAASVDGSRPGAFHAGVGGPSIPSHIMPTIAYHEAVPGHHYQIALSQELDLPDFRRFNQYNGYVEGWALYAERLAHEMGMYEDDPYGNIGRLELELLRAVRLVADTGIHAKEWTRKQAKDYMNSVVGWTHEVERYTVLPAQATGYLIGQQEILRLREAAERHLGEVFTYPSFHEVIVGSGSVPLEVLDGIVTEWIEEGGEG